jgi:hypothetical protein
MDAYYKWFYELRLRLERVGSFESAPPELRYAYWLLNHERTATGYRKPWGGYVVREKGTRSERKLEGLTTPLKDVFYPDAKGATTGGARTGGSSRGNATDREIANLVNKGDVAEAPNVYTMRVLAFLHKHGYQPFAAQFMVYDEQLGIGTELDMLCINANSRDPAGKNVVNIQLKTGFDKNYERTSGYLRSPFVDKSKLASTPYSYRNVHALQTLCEHMIVQDNYSNVLQESMVLVVSEEVTSLYRIGNEWLALRVDVRENLLARNKEGDDVEIKIHAIRAAAAKKKATMLFI